MAAMGGICFCGIISLVSRMNNVMILCLRIYIINKTSTTRVSVGLFYSSIILYDLNHQNTKYKVVVCLQEVINVP